MTTKKKLEHIPTTSMLAPPPIALVRLRDHFRDTYKLTGPQVEIMVVSSSKSLEQGFAHLSEVLAAGEQIERLHAFYHGLKGLFLNMGEPEWAAYAKEIEQKMLAGEELDHKRIVGELQCGVDEVLCYCGTTDAGLDRSKGG